MMSAANGRASAVQVVLHVARIEVIEQIENAQSYFHLVLLAAERELKFPQHLKIEGIELPESLRVARTDEVAQLWFTTE